MQQDEQVTTEAPAQPPTTDAPTAPANPPTTEAPAQPPPPTTAPPKDKAREEFSQLLNDYINSNPLQFTSRFEQLIDKYHPKA